MAGKKSQDRAVYKVPEAARVAGVGEGSIRRGISDGTVPHVKFGRNIVVPKEAFHKWLNSCGDRVGLSAA